MRKKWSLDPGLINIEETAKMAEEPVLYGLYVDRRILRVPQVQLLLFFFHSVIKCRRFYIFEGPKLPKRLPHTTLSF